MKVRFTGEYVFSVKTHRVADRTHTFCEPLAIRLRKTPTVESVCIHLDRQGK